ncbi:hypothetical protein DH2020_000777 [Rehmannia glutinosa]|uniref:HIT domain-containing protein n=1 Tax=Rehmannia glutinosa TaxID=99300 RepID=A0ABR0XXY1_REHGL
MPWSISALLFLVISFSLSILNGLLTNTFTVFDIFSGREVKRFVDLTADEIRDLWLSAQKIGCQLESYHKASSLTFTIQDGPQAGQTVPHVHIHILRAKAIDLKEKELKQKLDLDKERTDRSMEEMAEEADAYRKLLL